MQKKILDSFTLAGYGEYIYITFNRFCIAFTTALAASACYTWTYLTYSIVSCRIQLQCGFTACKSNTR